MFIKLIYSINPKINPTQVLFVLTAFKSSHIHKSADFFAPIKEVSLGKADSSSIQSLLAPYVNMSFQPLTPIYTQLFWDLCPRNTLPRVNFSLSFLFNNHCIQGEGVPLHMLGLSRAFQQFKEWVSTGGSKDCSSKNIGAAPAARTQYVIRGSHTIPCCKELLHTA